MLKKKNILKTGISDATKTEILEYILKGLEKETKKYFIVTPNPEILMLANKDLRYKKILNSAKLALPDGVGVMLAGRIMKREFKQRIPGVDLVESLCRAVEEKPITVGFLGGGRGIAEKTAECLVKKFPNLKVVFTASGSPDDKTVRLVKDQKKEIDILFVAFGSPKQEIWIYENLDKLPVKVAIGVGGAFDFLSGRVKRSPLWIRKIGFEWLFRLIYQPWRAKRQASLIKFIFLVIKEKFNINNV
ncbi:hypothetical protein A3F03_03700 [Candidatus Roizmanbacteria bacterium RIFCSPHIGHO2_12_FULL_41_11]|uniref:Glycosyl transferase n=1 Tax=Candidatus Roizmanbacteria bacterium RIFCSPHIGHO2_12_FULL_41_11 TaxID=1802052 RepID=A0A1F7I292_9BACT|nr:MAG: hypothetical protein A3F03_03700 [Candidatus Roizmanbacteria bacterium RIFCSPHIGHO2_12_FULL_41_11]